MMGRASDQSGFTAVEWAIGLGVIVLPLMIAVMSIAPILDRLSTAQTMAQEAARTMALADDWSTGESAAQRLAHQIGRNHGIAESEWCTTGRAQCVMVEISAMTPGTLRRGEEVIVTVRVPVAAITIPFIGEFAALTLTGSHTERVDDYRSFPEAVP